MLRDLAQAEDRSKQAVLRRALTLYAAQSAEYQATKLG
jgi:predicted transcriptional regulator